MTTPRLPVAATVFLALTTFAASAQAPEIIPPGPTSRGAVLIYGNYCGPGNRGPGYRPIDALDRACAHHDVCSADLLSGTLTACACNHRLEAEAGAVAHDPRAPAHTRETARFIADFATALPCQ